MEDKPLSKETLEVILKSIHETPDGKWPNDIVFRIVTQLLNAMEDVDRMKPKTQEFLSVKDLINSR